MRCTRHGARVRKGATRRKPDVTLTTDSDTWLRLREGEFSGVEAFQRRLLAVRGNLDHAVAFEGMFRLPNGRPPLLQIHDVPVGRHRISTLTMGEGPDVLLLHGLGGTRASLFETAAALSSRYRVHALDLPGFGSSSKPATGGYNARWFAELMLGLMDATCDRRRAPGRQLDGRPGRDRDRPDGARAGQRRSACCAPPWPWSSADSTRSCGCCAPSSDCCRTACTARSVAAQFWSIFFDRDAVDPAVADLMVDEFRRIYHSAGARYAFLSCGAQHLPRGPVRPQRLLPPALKAAAARAVRLG